MKLFTYLPFVMFQLIWLVCRAQPLPPPVTALQRAMQEYILENPAPDTAGAATEEVLARAALLTETGAFSKAASYLSQVVQQTPAKEMYNQLGRLTVAEALAYFSESEKPHFLAEITPGNQIIAFPSPKAKIRLLHKAIGYFDKAASFDAGYPPTYVNRATASLLLGEEEDAKYYASRALFLSKKQDWQVMEAEAWNLLGLVAVRQGHSKQADAYFAKAEQHLEGKIEGRELLRVTGMGSFFTMPYPYLGN